MADKGKKKDGKGKKSGGFGKLMLYGLVVCCGGVGGTWYLQPELLSHGLEVVGLESLRTTIGLR